MEKIIGIESIFTLIDVHIILTLALCGKIKKSIISAMLCALLLICGFISFVLTKALLGQIAICLCTLLVFIIPLVSVSGMKKAYVLFVTLTFVGIASAIAVSFMWIVKICGANEQSLYIVDIIANCMILLISILVGKRILLKHLSQYLPLLSKPVKYIIVSSIWFGILFANMFGTFFSEYSSHPAAIFIQCLAVTLILLTSIMCPLVVVNNISSSHYKSILNTINKHMASQSLHYEMMAEKDNEIKKFRHDFRNLMIGVTGLLKNNDIERAILHLNTCMNSIEDNCILFETGSHIVDALLFEKKILTDELNTIIEFEGAIPEHLLNPVDLCIIFGNALDNALEACAKLPAQEKKTIAVSSFYNNGFLFIRVENPVLSKVQINSGTITSTKKSTDFHGIGLSSIQSTAEKYEGRMNLICTDHMFKIEVDLDLNTPLTAEVNRVSRVPTTL